MSAQHTPELFARAAKFYENQPTGQYDDEAAHALRCHHELLEALHQIVGHDLADENAIVAVARAAIAKATGGAA